MLFSQHFLLGLICVDKRRECPNYAAKGDCITNGWTESNCRISCRSKCDTYPIKPNGKNQIAASLCYQTVKSSRKVLFDYLYWCFTPWLYVCYDRKNNLSFKFANTVVREMTFRGPSFGEGLNNLNLS